MIDKRELADLEREFKELALSDLTDDVGTIGDIKFRASRMSVIEDLVGEEISNAWFNDVEKPFIS